MAVEVQEVSKFTPKTETLQIGTQKYNGRDKTYLDIRHYYMADEGLRPSRKGISLDAYSVGTLLTALAEHRAEIEEQLGIKFTDFGFPQVRKPVKKAVKKSSRKKAA